MKGREIEHRRWAAPDIEHVLPALHQAFAKRCRQTGRADASIIAHGDSSRAASPRIGAKGQAKQFRVVFA
jgi:hypothetical protein